MGKEPLTAGQLPILIWSTSGPAAPPVSLIVNKRALKDNWPCFLVSVLLKSKEANSTTCTSLCGHMCAENVGSAQRTRVNTFFFFLCIIFLFLQSIKTWIFKTTSNKYSWNIKMFEKQKKLLSSFIRMFSSLLFSLSFSHKHTCTHTHMHTQICTSAPPGFSHGWKRHTFPLHSLCCISTSLHLTDEAKKQGESIIYPEWNITQTHY